MLQLSYEPLWETLRSQGLLHVDLTRNGIITSAALKKLERGEPVSLNVVRQLCDGLGALDICVHSIIRDRCFLNKHRHVERCEYHIIASGSHDYRNLF